MRNSPSRRYRRPGRGRHSFSREHSARTWLKRHLRDGGSCRHGQMHHILRTHQQAILNDIVGSRSKNIHAFHTACTERSPASPSRPRIPRNQGWGKRRRTRGHPKPAKAGRITPTAEVIRHPTPRLAGNPRIAHGRVPAPHSHAVWRPAHGGERRPAVTKAREVGPLAIGIEITPAIHGTPSWNSLIRHREFRLRVAIGTPFIP